MSRRLDLVVVGGGTAGLTAAFGAAGVGARVALVERARTGGDCLWTGCVPSKTLLAAARRAHDMRRADRVGLEPGEPHVDLGRVMDRVHEVIATIQPHDSPERLRRAGVEVVHGHARFVEPGRVDVDGRAMRYRTALVATGSRPETPPFGESSGVEILTTDTVWGLREGPGRLAVLGGGPVGVELGQAFARLGAVVTLIETEPCLLPGFDVEAGRVVEGALRGEGVEVRTATVASRVEDGALVVQGPAGEARVPVDRVLSATGRLPVTGDLGLDRVGVETDHRGYVRVDGTLRTTGRKVFAAGDVTGLAPFTHVAGAHGAVAVANALFGLRRRPGHGSLPWVVFTDPEVAHVGMSEEAARARHGDDLLVARFPYDRLDRAVASGATAGFAKLVADPRGRLLGATVVGEAAGESVAELAAWLRSGGRLRDIGTAVHAYPTFAEASWRAGLEHLLERAFTPRVRRAARPVLATLRWLDRP